MTEPWLFLITNRRGDFEHAETTRGAQNVHLKCYQSLDILEQLRTAQ